MLSTKKFLPGVGSVINFILLIHFGAADVCNWDKDEETAAFLL